jgi:hypothetical protein
MFCKDSAILAEETEATFPPCFERSDLEYDKFTPG